MPELTAWLRLHLSRCLSLHLFSLVFFHLWLQCCSSETSTSPPVTSPSLLICAASFPAVVQHCPLRSVWVLRRLFFKWLNMNWSLSFSLCCITLYSVDSQTIYSNRTEYKWGNTASCAYLWNSAQRQFCWTQSFNFIFGEQHSFLKILLLKLLWL